MLSSSKIYGSSLTPLPATHQRETPKRFMALNPRGLKIHQSHGNYTGQRALGKRLIAEKPHGIKIFLKRPPAGENPMRPSKKIILKKQIVRTFGALEAARLHKHRKRGARGGPLCFDGFFEDVLGRKPVGSSFL
jgi:hypothetical protein